MTANLPPLPPGMEWIDDPTTVDPYAYLRHMATADQKPGDATKRARSKLTYALEQKHIMLALPPFPRGHVFTDIFFRWLWRKYPTIQGIDPHYRRPLLTSSCTIRWEDAPKPSPPPDPLTALQEENKQLKAQIADLEKRLNEAKKEIDGWKDRDQKRRKNCGRRPLTEKKIS